MNIINNSADVPVTIDDPVALRMLSGDPSLKSVELYIVEPDGHKYGPGETRMLTGLEDFPEYNGQSVEITSIRKDGPKGKAYYIKGKINEFINWVYEYRLV